MSIASSGLRERKKQRTRHQIQLAAYRLILERGWPATTIVEIAAAAEVAPRTVSGYFPNKLDIVFGDAAARSAMLEDALSDLDLSITDGIKLWLGRVIGQHDRELERLRYRAICADSDLIAHDRLLFMDHERIVAEAFGRRTGQTGLGPSLVGACAVTVIRSFRGFANTPDGFADRSARAFGLLEQVITSLESE